MMTNVKITDKQAKSLYDAFHDANFRMVGLGWFDLNERESIEVIKILFNSTNDKDRRKKLNDLFDAISLD